MGFSWNMFCQGFSVIFENVGCNIFIIKKLHKLSKMLSFLPRWDYCWKCEFGTDLKTENYCHYDGEQLGFYRKSAYQNTE